MSEYMFGLGPGYLSVSAARAAKRAGATLVNYCDPGCGCGRGCARECPKRRRHWFATGNFGEPANTARANRVLAAVQQAATKSDRELL